MGIYLNPQNTLFQNMKNSEIYVDHSLMIENINKIINTENNKLCVSRPRRFGKSTDANMLVAYYSKGCDSSNIFKDLKISQTELYQKHLNQHNVIHINMQDFVPLSLVCNNIIGINDTFTDNKSLRNDRCRPTSRCLFGEMWLSHIRPDRYLHRIVAVNIGAALAIILFRIRQNRNTPVQIARP